MRIIKLQQSLSLLLCLLGPMTSHADQTAKPNTQYTTCPPINKVYKSTQNHWGTSDANFRSHTLSFANKLDTFLGAQWQGATLGHIICLYKPHENKNTGTLFTVILTFNQLVYEPVNLTHWQPAKKTSSQLYNCVSRDVKHCAFVVRPAPIKTDIYNEALQLRQEASPYGDTNNNF